MSQQQSTTVSAVDPLQAKKDTTLEVLQADFDLVVAELQVRSERPDRSVMKTKAFWNNTLQMGVRERVFWQARLRTVCYKTWGWAILVKHDGTWKGLALQESSSDEDEVSSAASSSLSSSAMKPLTKQTVELLQRAATTVEMARQEEISARTPASAPASASDAFLSATPAPAESFVVGKKPTQQLSPLPPIFALKVEAVPPQPVVDGPVFGPEPRPGRVFRLWSWTKATAKAAYVHPATVYVLSLGGAVGVTMAPAVALPVATGVACYVGSRMVAASLGAATAIKEEASAAVSAAKVEVVSAAAAARAEVREMLAPVTKMTQQVAKTTSVAKTAVVNFNAAHEQLVLSVSVASALIGMSGLIWNVYRRRHFNPAVFEEVQPKLEKGRLSKKESLSIQEVLSVRNAVAKQLGALEVMCCVALLPLVGLKGLPAVSRLSGTVHHAFMYASNVAGGLSLLGGWFPSAQVEDALDAVVVSALDNPRKQKELEKQASEDIRDQLEADDEGTNAVARWGRKHPIWVATIIVMCLLGATQMAHMWYERQRALKRKCYTVVDAEGNVKFISDLGVTDEPHGEVRIADARISDRLAPPTAEGTGSKGAERVHAAFGHGGKSSIARSHRARVLGENQRVLFRNMASSIYIAYDEDGKSNETLKELIEKGCNLVVEGLDDYRETRRELLSAGVSSDKIDAQLSYDPDTVSKFVQFADATEYGDDRDEGNNPVNTKKYRSMAGAPRAVRLPAKKEGVIMDRLAQLLGVSTGKVDTDQAAEAEAEQPKPREKHWTGNCAADCVRCRFDASDAKRFEGAKSRGVHCNRCNVPNPPGWFPGGACPKALCIKKDCACPLFHRKPRNPTLVATDRKIKNNPAPKAPVPEGFTGGTFMKPEAIYPSVFRLTCGDQLGNAFLTGNLVVTCAHLLPEGAEHVILQDIDDNSVTTERSAWVKIPDRDIAVFVPDGAVNQFAAKKARFKIGAPPTTWTSAILYGFNYDETKGKTGYICTMGAIAKVTPTEFTYAMETCAGLCGSPVMNRQGQVMGIHTQGDPNGAQILEPTFAKTTADFLTAHRQQ